MNKLIFCLNSDFYNKAAIEEALNDFKDVCNGKIMNEKFEVMLTSKKDIGKLENEFCNYVLGLMKNKCII